MFKIFKEEIEIGGKKLSLETGKIARQADGAIIARCGETVVISTVVGAKKVNPETDYFPLSVNYQEKYYAAGKIPGGYFKREARPTESETLISRLIDRPIRPLFPEGFRNEVQVLPTVLSYDNENEADVLSIIASSAALAKTKDSLKFISSFKESDRVALLVNSSEDNALIKAFRNLSNVEILNISNFKPEYVFHLAAYTGGLGRTTVYPASTLTPNLIMDGNVIDSAKNENVERFLYASCSCVYPDLEKDFSEDDAWIDNPPQMHASYSWSKRIGELQAISHSKEYGMNVAIVRPANSYGPREIIDPNHSHVIGALILKALSKKKPFVIWGDGSPIREYIFANDAARGMILALENYCEADPINLSSGETVTIKDLAEKILTFSSSA